MWCPSELIVGSRVKSGVVCFRGDAGNEWSEPDLLEEAIVSSDTLGTQSRAESESR